MSELNRSQLAPVRAPDVHITQVRDGQGNKLAVEQSFRIPDVIETDYGDKKALEALFGSGEYANGLFTGKSELSFSITIGSIGAAMLNALSTGREVQAKQRRKHTDKTGVQIPGSVSVDWVIKNIIGINLARVDSITSIKIGAVTLTSDETPVANQYYWSGGLITFGEPDIGKSAVVTYVSNGRTVVATIKIPTKRTWWPGGFADANPTVKNDATPLVKSAYSMLVGPAAGKFMGTGGGVLYFNAAMTLASGKKLTIAANCDKQKVSYSIATLPTAGYNFHIDAPGGSTFVNNDEVELLSNAGTAMTGVAVGETLTKVVSGPVTGEYTNDAGGEYTWAAADAGDRVRVYYTPSYFVLRPDIVNGGDFIESRGVYNSRGVAFQRVEITQPLSIGNNQFGVDDSGAHYFDFTNQLDTVFLDYRYEIEGGSLIEVDNQPMGNSPAFRVSISYEFEGDNLDIEMFYAKSKGMGVPMKQGAASPIKFEIMASEDRDHPTPRVWEASMSSS